MGTTITAQDGTTDTMSPLGVVAWAPATESGNIVHHLIDGTIAVSIVGEAPRSGELRMIFDDDADADAARTFLSRRTSFALADTDRPSIDMEFIRQGQMSTVINDEARQVWEFSVGFQEVLP
jgi:hypothetical protein